MEENIVGLGNGLVRIIKVHVSWFEHSHILKVEKKRKEKDGWECSKISFKLHEPLEKGRIYFG